MSSESTGGGGDLKRCVERLEASLGTATEGSLEERFGAIERLIGPEAAEAAGLHLPVTQPLAAVSLADAGLDTGRPDDGGRDHVYRVFRESQVACGGSVRALVCLRAVL